jgi:hypothetical protein
MIVTVSNGASRHRGPGSIPALMYDIYGGWSAAGRGVSPSTLVSPCKYYFTNARYSNFVHLTPKVYLTEQRASWNEAHLRDRNGLVPSCIQSDSHIGLLFTYSGNVCV